MEKEIIMELLQAAIMIATLLITRYAIPYLVSRIGSERLQQAAMLAQQAVLYAEQVYSPDYASGQERKDVVVELLGKLLREHGINVSEYELDMLIEAAVKTMNAAKEAKQPETETIEED